MNDMNKFKIEEIKKLINDSSACVKQNKEWETRYQRYIEELITISSMKSTFRLPPEISKHRRITDRDRYIYDLRFVGHSIGTLRILKGKPQICINKQMSGNFGYVVDEKASEEWYEWDSKAAKDFRSYFHKCQKTSYATSSREAKIQEMLLNEMCANKRRSNLTNIRPVLLDRAYFTMPTPLKASTHAPSYADCKGGGIDILAHVGKGKGCNLGIIELKDEYNEREPQKEVMKQALTYATFIAHLLRSSIGQDWWKLLEFNGEMRKQLKLYVLTFMPQPEEEVEEFVGDFTLDDLENVTLCCRSIYFNLSEDNKFHFTSNNFKTILCE